MQLELRQNETDVTLTLEVSLDAGFAIGTLDSPFHDVSISQEDARTAFLTLKEGDVPANRDFELVWAPQQGGNPSAALFTEEVQGEDYFLLMVTPPEAQAVTTVPPREVIFVIDTSGSMGGESIRQARESLAMALQRLKPGDTFNVIEFNSVTQALFDAPRPVSDETLRRGLTWVEGLEATGGTEMLPALRTALAMSGQDDGRLEQIIFLTDGAIGNEQQLFDTIAGRGSDARIFTVGIGSAPNSYFMTRAAELGRGTFTHIGDVSQVAERMGELFVKLETPVITDLQLEWPDGAVIDTSYTVMPDVYAGEMLTVAAQSSIDTGEISLTGMSGGQPWKVNLTLDQASARSGISKLWARKKIASLELDRARHTSTPEALDKEILGIALTHELVSRLTSLVAVDVTPSRPVGEELVTQHVPLNLPDGWDFEKVFGKGELIGNARTIRKVHASPETETPARAKQPDPEPKPVMLPQTATLSELKIGLGLLLLGHVRRFVVVKRSGGFERGSDLLLIRRALLLQVLQLRAPLLPGLLVGVLGGLVAAASNRRGLVRRGGVLDGASVGRAVALLDVHGAPRGGWVGVLRQGLEHAALAANGGGGDLAQGPEGLDLRLLALVRLLGGGSRGHGAARRRVVVGVRHGSLDGAPVAGAIGRVVAEELGVERGARGIAGQGFDDPPFPALGDADGGVARDALRATRERESRGARGERGGVSGHLARAVGNDGAARGGGAEGGREDDGGHRGSRSGPNVKTRWARRVCDDD